MSTLDDYEARRRLAVLEAVGREWVEAERAHNESKSNPAVNVGTGARLYRAEQALHEALRERFR